MLRSFSFTINWKTAKLFTCIVLRFLTQTILYHINDFYLCPYVFILFLFVFVVIFKCCFLLLMAQYLLS